MFEWVFGRNEKRNGNKGNTYNEIDTGGNDGPMYRKRFDKETFKEAVKDNVKTLYRKKIEEASQQQIFLYIGPSLPPVSISLYVFPDYFHDLRYL